MQFALGRKGSKGVAGLKYKGSTACKCKTLNASELRSLILRSY
jgi:hypothetical protein